MAEPVAKEGACLTTEKQRDQEDEAEAQHLLHGPIACLL